MVPQVINYTDLRFIDGEDHCSTLNIAFSVIWYFYVTMVTLLITQFLMKKFTNTAILTYF